MNISEIRQALINGNPVRVIGGELDGEILYLYHLRETNNEISTYVKDSFGATHEVDYRDIELIFESHKVNSTNKFKSIPNTYELKKEIAFLLIQNGYAIDKGFKDTVDNVVDAITL